MNSDRRMYLRRSRRQGNRHRQPKRPQNSFGSVARARWIAPAERCSARLRGLPHQRVDRQRRSHTGQRTVPSSPVPLVLHLASAGVYSILGAFQFATGFRRRRPGWHRAAGRLLVPCGLLVGLSALWMTLFYPRPDGTGVLLYVLRLVFGSAMLVSIVLGLPRSGAARSASTGHG
jgi:hypothetical protein